MATSITDKIAALKAQRVEAVRDAMEEHRTPGTREYHKDAAARAALDPRVRELDEQIAAARAEQMESVG